MEATLKVGDIVEAEVSKISDFGAFVKMSAGGIGLIHISKISDSFVKDVRKHLKVGDKVKARVIKLGPGKKVDLSLKESHSRPPKNLSARRQVFVKQSGFKSSDFEEKLKRFLQQP